MANGFWTPFEDYRDLRGWSCADGCSGPILLPLLVLVDGARWPGRARTHVGGGRVRPIPRASSQLGLHYSAELGTGAVGGGQEDRQAAARIV